MHWLLVLIIAGTIPETAADRTAQAEGLCRQHRDPADISRFLPGWERCAQLKAAPAVKFKTAPPSGPNDKERAVIDRALRDQESK